MCDAVGRITLAMLVRQAASRAIRGVGHLDRMRVRRGISAAGDDKKNAGQRPQHHPEGAPKSCHGPSCAANHCAANSGQGGPTALDQQEGIAAKNRRAAGQCQQADNGVRDDFPPAQGANQETNRAQEERPIHRAGDSSSGGRTIFQSACHGPTESPAGRRASPSRQPPRHSAKAQSHQRERDTGNSGAYRCIQDRLVSHAGRP